MSLRWRRLWQPGRLLFWQWIFFNVMSSVCGWALRALPLNGLGLALIGFVALLNVAFGLGAMVLLLRTPRPDEAEPPHRTAH